ncbi:MULTISPECIES: hypothetical protein [Pseudoalteromonas]|uniref:DUF2946 domain-containing protein n=1 Tax=Pseudoalteromonas obscura TaxID=3048491 RepID=A0ABT7EGZ4_9GAMM|nr:MULTISPECIES: hypothetical protein [Pseudoalteromonas]MBQ4835941.1 hypothetical protein [Pseudoalteromonas luteoviolacea]MDK2594293.1 hypothetical protein [Pseudoalteromonas sp. P94(2023)]
MSVRIIVNVMLMIVIALQSVSSVASLSDLHLVDAQHLQTTHLHQHNERVTTVVEFDEHGHAIQDCHHCGHCSGSHTSWVTVQPSTNTILKTSLSTFTVPDAQIRKRVESKYKPPILS